MSEIPVVTIAGKSYPVPPLVARQLRIVIPAIMRLGILVGDSTKLSTALYDDMLTIIAWGALWPNGDKKGTADGHMATLLDSAISFAEMQAAMKVIRDQTGLFVAAPTEGAPPGEANP